MALSSNATVELLAAYSGLTLLASLAGGLIPLLIRPTHTRLQVATSFVAGMMLGVAVLHLLPHAWEEFRSIDQTVRYLLGGFLVMFFIQRFFHFHHHDVPDEAPESSEEAAEEGAVADGGHGHREHDHTLAQKSARQLSWGGAALGLTLHSLIDGVALAASVQADAHGGQAKGLVGLGTFAVIILHKPFDAMAIGTLMVPSGWSKFWRHAVNLAFALMIPAGVLLFEIGSTQLAGSAQPFLGAALAFTAGTFLCIAASDLLPELQFHSHDRVKLSIALVLGLALAAAIGAVEPHQHAPGRDASQERHRE